MDFKVKIMIKFIEIDVDLFVRRVEMYYKKCLEFMKLVEELYRVYCVLVERYDYIIVQFCYVYKVMVEVFFDQVFFDMIDDFVLFIFGFFKEDGVISKSSLSYLNELY